MALHSDASAQSTETPPPLPAETRTADLTGNWQFIPIPLPERNVTHILVSRSKDRVFLGTTGGVAVYDGVEARVPQFENPDAQQPLYVNSLVEAGDHSVIVGTINDSLWRWADGKIAPLYGACPRGSDGCGRAEWALARSEDGAIYVASSSFAPNQADAISALRVAVTERVIPVQASASFLGFAGEDLVATSQSGSIFVIDRVSGKSTRQFDLDLPSGSFVRNISYATGQIEIGTDTNCFSVGLAGGVTVVALASGNCTAVYTQRDGTTWLSTDFLYRHDPSGWMRWSPGQSGAITASAVAEDGLSNLWIGGPTGLWRYFDVSREYRFAGDKARISSMVSDADGGVVVGLESGEAWRLTRKLEATRLDLPTLPDPPASPYYPGALLANDPSGTLWALTNAGLFRIAGTKADRVGEYPVGRLDGNSAPSSLAISAEGKACIGVVWSTKVLCLTNGEWQDSAEVEDHIGGAAVGALAFDDAGSMLSVGVRSITVTSASSVEVGPFNPTPFGRNHLFGAIASTTLVPGADMVASGGWGGTVFLKRSGEIFVDVGHGRSDVSEQPYIIRQFASHPALGLLAASDEGLFRWEGTPIQGSWTSLRDIDPRLAAPVSGVVASIARGFWIGSGSRATLLDLPAAAPGIAVEQSPSTETIDTNAIVYRLSIPGLVGLPTLKTTSITYDPPIANAERRLYGPANRLDLSNLADLTTYHLTATVTDGFLNTGPPSASHFTVRLPFYRNPYELAAAILAALCLVGVLLTRRGPTGFLLRRVGGLKWTTEKSDPRFAIGVSTIGADTVRYELDAPSALTLIKLEVDVSSRQIDGRPKDVLPYLVNVAEGKVGLIRESFDSANSRVAEVLGADALPDNLRFTTSQIDSGTISLDLSKTLLWLPLELADDGGGEQMLLRYAIGRTVSADVLAEAAAPRSSRLKVAIFAPNVDASETLLPRAADEARAVAAAARSWGADVVHVPANAAKDQVLAALCSAHLFHYAGHAEFIPDAAGQSYLPIQGGRIMAEDVANALKSNPHNLLLAFINGCGSSREASWDRGEQVYGFGSAFLNNAAYFVGAQWPIGDEFAAAFASEFYARLFPSTYSLWWRLVRRDPLHGLPFAEALRLARHHVREMGPAATQTWSSYVFYGDPTRRLVLQ